MKKPISCVLIMLLLLAVCLPVAAVDIGEQGTEPFDWGEENAPALAAAWTDQNVTVAVNRAALGFDRTYPVKVFVAFYDTESNQCIAVSVRNLTAGEREFSVAPASASCTAKAFLTTLENKPLCAAVAAQPVHP